MRGELENPEIDGLDGILGGIHALRSIPRPPMGWIRAMREAAGVSAGELGRILGVSRQLPLQFEKAEAEDSITLKSLRSVANALDCDLVYALVPRAGSVRELAESRGPGQRSARAAGSSKAVKEELVPEIEASAEAPARDEERTDPHFCD
jgi:predicted DNA-binding mobile mystery protein A